MNSRAIDMPPHLGEDKGAEWPLYTRMYQEQRAAYAEKTIWILDGVENFNYVTHLKHGFGSVGLSTSREADSKLMADQANRVFKRFCLEIEEYLTKGIRHHEVVNEGTDDAYLMQYGGGLNDPQIPELTIETAQLRLLSGPCMIPQRQYPDSDLTPTQAFVIAFTLTPTRGREVGFAELIR